MKYGRRRAPVSRRTRGLTFLELVVVFGIMAIILPSICGALSVALSYESRVRSTSMSAELAVKFEDKCRKLISSAMLTATTTDPNSYFIVSSGPPSVIATSGTTGTTGTSGSTTTTGSVGAQVGNSLTGIGDTLVFTGFGQSPPGAVLGANSDDDFETLNNQAGPQGGLEEISLSMATVGNAGDKTGMFLREQRPPDNDPTQGGMESLLSADIQTVTFECFDGLLWQPSWDTRTGSRRLPAAVRVTYTLVADPSTQHIFIVRLPMSDVTATNPVTQTSGGTTP